MAHRRLVQAETARDYWTDKAETLESVQRIYVEGAERSTAVFLALGKLVDRAINGNWSLPMQRTKIREFLRWHGICPDALERRSRDGEKNEG